MKSPMTTLLQIGMVSIGKKDDDGCGGVKLTRLRIQRSAERRASRPMALGNKPLRIRQAYVRD